MDAELPGRQTDFTCPECNGTVYAFEDEDGVLRSRCRVGHAYDSDAFLAAKNDAVEQALWIGQQTLHERAQMLDTLSREEKQR